MGGMKPWTVAETTELIVKSWLWMTLLTAPVATVIAVAWWNPIALSLFVPASLIFTGIGAAIGGIASIPFSHGLSRALMRVRSRLVHAIAHSLLAGALAAACFALFLVMNDGDDIWTWPLIASAAAGIAAAIARWRLDRTRMTAEPTPADAAEDAEDAEDAGA